MAAIDVDARQLVMEAWSMERRQSPTLAAVQAVQAVARLETGYSTTWKTPGVHNWGAITCNRVATAEGDCGPNCFLSRDHDAQGRVVKRCFRRYAKPLDGVRALLREMLVRRPAVDAVVNAGDVLAIAQAMHDTRYFEAPVPKYAHAMLEHAGWIARTLGEPLMLRGAAAAPPRSMRPSRRASRWACWRGCGSTRSRKRGRSSDMHATTDRARLAAIGYELDALREHGELTVARVRALMVEAEIDRSGRR
jgi:hypothetical protein